MSEKLNDLFKKELMLDDLRPLRCNSNTPLVYVKDGAVDKYLVIGRREDLDEPTIILLIDDSYDAYVIEGDNEEELLRLYKSIEKDLVELDESKDECDYECIVDKYKMNKVDLDYVATF